jgi:acyl-lipid omega-6 desaturase (Delta-12 desaturase)
VSLNDATQILRQSEWLRPSEAYGWSAVLRNTIPFFALLFAAPSLRQWSTVAPWLLVPVVGLLLYRLSNVMHDCGHRTLFKSPRVNDRVGRMLGAITGIDFQSFTRLHWQHHRSYGEPDDPQGFHYLGLQEMSRARALWHLLVPLFGLHLRHVLSESVLSPQTLKRTLRSGEIFLVVGVQAVI